MIYCISFKFKDGLDIFSLQFSRSNVQEEMMRKLGIGFFVHLFC